MKYRKIVLAGGNGYLGTVLAGWYATRAEEVIILSRKPKADEGHVKTVLWDGTTEGHWQSCLEGADMLVNLCGKNVNCRYTARNREAILESRLRPTALLGRAIQKLANPPKLWINVTSATIYRHAEDRPQTEQDGELGSGFSVAVCRRWEQAFFEADIPATRRIALRMGIVLGRHDGVFPRLLNLTRLGLGGRQGNGRQYVAWVHERDAVRVTEWLLNNPQQQGIFNCTAPAPVSNEVLMRTLRRAYGAVLGLPSPVWLLKIGAWIIGTETELILKSRWVLPRRLTDAGFCFTFPQIDEAITECLKS